MSRFRKITLSFVLLFLSASTALAQFQIITADELRSLMHGKQKVMVVDSRSSEEYQAGHIPGALNIPSERMKMDAVRLPKDKATPIIFYCRGAG